MPGLRQAGEYWGLDLEAEFAEVVCGSAGGSCMHCL